MKKSLFFLITIFIITNCSSYQTSNQNKFAELESTAQSLYGPKYYFLFNSDSTFVICTNKEQTKSQSSFRFFVYDNHKKQTVFNDNVSQGNVSWLNNNQIKVSWTPGTVKGEEGKESPNKYIFDVKSGKKVNP